MAKSPQKAYLVFAALLAAATCNLSLASDLKDLETLVNQNQHAAAWKKAIDMRNAWESDPAFDHLYGAAALANNHPQEAIFALERVVLMQPGNVEARLLLGKAYLATGDRESATKQFATVRASAPSPALRRETEQLLGKSAVGERVLSGFIETIVGHDNNVNSATGSTAITPPSGLVIDIDPAARKTSDMYGSVLAGIDFFRPLDSQTTLELKGRYAERDNFSSNAFDSNLYRASAGIRHQREKDLYRVTLTTHDFRLSDSDYQRMTGLSGDWVHQLTSSTALLGNLYMNAVRYPEASRRDVNQYIGHAGLQITQADLTHTVGMLLGNEDSPRNAGSFNARDFTSIYYDIRYAVAPEHQLYGRIYVQDARFSGEDPVFLENRQDVLKQVTLGHTWRINAHWRWKNELGYSDNKGDVNMYSFERTYLQTGVRYSF
jgi:tetratricopeptide (TPR) repeat protein